MHPLHAYCLFLEFKWSLVKIQADSRLPTQEEMIWVFSQLASSMNTIGFSHINLPVRQKSVSWGSGRPLHDGGIILAYLYKAFTTGLPHTQETGPSKAVPEQVELFRCSASDPCHTFLKENSSNLKTLGAESLLHFMLIPKVKYCMFLLA